MGDEDLAGDGGAVYPNGDRLDAHGGSVKAGDHRFVNFDRSGFAVVPLDVDDKRTQLFIEHICFAESGLVDRDLLYLGVGRDALDVEGERRGDFGLVGKPTFDIKSVVAFVERDGITVVFFSQRRIGIGVVVDA